MHLRVGRVCSIQGHLVVDADAVSSREATNVFRFYWWKDANCPWVRGRSDLRAVCSAFVLDLALARCSRSRLARAWNDLGERTGFPSDFDADAASPGVQVKKTLGFPWRWRPRRETIPEQSPPPASGGPKTLARQAVRLYRAPGRAPCRSTITAPESDVSDRGPRRWLTASMLRNSAKARMQYPLPPRAWTKAQMVLPRASVDELRQPGESTPTH